MDIDRYLEHTAPRLEGRFGFSNGIVSDELLRIPALVMPELQDTRRPQLAYVGTVHDVVLDGRKTHYRFTPDQTIKAIPSSDIESFAAELHINVDRWEFSRNHWAVKDVDLYRALLVRPTLTAHRSPNAFSMPDRPPARDLVSLMMPFDLSWSRWASAFASGFSTGR